MRLRKPQDFILLILRTLAVLALIGVFLRPLLFSDDKLTGFFEKKNLVLIVDASASMAFVERSQTRFATACAEASDILSGLSSRDRANVIWLKSEPEAVFPDDLASNIAFLKDRLRRAEVTFERGAVDKAFQVATKLLENADGKREICVVSDFQQTAWENFSPNLPEGVDLIHIKVGDSNAANLALVRLEFEPKRPVVGEMLSIVAEVENFSTEDTQSTLFSELGESRRSENVVLPAGQKTSVTIRHRLTQSGIFPIHVSLAEDSFPADDRRSLVVNVRPFLKVAVLAGDDPDTARLWTRAIQSLGWATPEWIESTAIADGTTDQFDAVFLAGWKGDSEASFSPETKVVCLPATGDASTAWQQLSGKRGEAGVFTLQSGQGDAVKLAIAKRDDPLFDLFRGSDKGMLEGVSGTTRLVSPKPLGGEILLSWKDGQPALTRLAPNRYWWAIPLSDVSGNWAGRVEFVPFIGELLLSDRSLSGSGNSGAIDFETGDVVLWSAPDEVKADELSAIAPNGKPLPFRGETGGRFSVGPIGTPGMVEWRTDDTPIGYSAVNFPIIESNLETLPFDEVERTATVAAAGGSDVRYLRDGMKLWPWLLGAAVIFLMMEAGVMLWAARTA